MKKTYYDSVKAAIFRNDLQAMSQCLSKVYAGRHLKRPVFGIGKSVCQDVNGMLRLAGSKDMS